MKGPIAVTGAAGFIGRNVVSELNRRGYRDLLLVDRLGSDERWRNLVGLAFDDLIAPEQFLADLESENGPRPGTIIHLGACSATTERDADYLLENNYRYSRRLCTWCLDHDARLVYASSAATYGDGTYGYSDDDATTPVLRPLNMYGYSKQLFDLWALASGALTRIVGLKYFNVYGAFEDHKGDMRSVVNKAYARIAAGGDIELFRSYRADYADGEQRRDFISVDDVVRVTLHFAETQSVSGLYNCGTGRARTWLDLAMALFAAVGRPPSIRFVDMPEQLRGKYQYFTEADTAKLHSSGYVQPFIELEDGISSYVRSHLALHRGDAAAIPARAALASG